MKFCTSDEPERSAEFHVASNPAVGSSPDPIKPHATVRDNRVVHLHKINGHVISIGLPSIAAVMPKSDGVGKLLGRIEALLDAQDALASSSSRPLYSRTRAPRFPHCK